MSKPDWRQNKKTATAHKTRTQSEQKKHNNRKILQKKNRLTISWKGKKKEKSHTHTVECFALFSSKRLDCYCMRFEYNIIHVDCSDSSTYTYFIRILYVWFCEWSHLLQRRLRINDLNQNDEEEYSAILPNQKKCKEEFSKWCAHEYEKDRNTNRGHTPK